MNSKGIILSTAERAARVVPRICFFAFFFLVFSIKILASFTFTGKISAVREAPYAATFDESIAEGAMDEEKGAADGRLAAGRKLSGKVNEAKIFANEKESSVAQLRQVLFDHFPIDANREEIDLCFQRFISSNFSNSKTSFYSAGERAYWETLKYPCLWQELCESLDRELVQFGATGNVSDELRFIIVQLYFFGRLEHRPIFLCDGKGIDTEDGKLPFSAAIGPAIEVARFVRQTGARKVFEVFSGRGNMTILLSLAGLEELVTVELDTHLDIEVSWKIAIDQLFEDIPSVFWPKVTKPLFLSGDVFEIDLPSADCTVMDPPYGFASSCHGSTSTAFPFFLDVLACLQEGPFQNIYALIPAEWISFIHLFTERSEPVAIQQSIDQILQKSVYHQSRPDKWTSFIQAAKEDAWLKILRGKIGRIRGISSGTGTPIQNVLGKELNIFQIHP